MYSISSLDEMPALLTQLKKKNYFSGYKTGFEIDYGLFSVGSESDDHTKHAWSSKHHLVKFDDTIYDVKVPNLSGNIVRWIRPFTEKRHNDGYVLFENTYDSFEREQEIYKELNKRNFPTFKHINEKVPGTVMTQYEEIKHLPDTEITVDALTEATQTLRTLHEEGFIHGNPGIHTFAYRKDGTMITHNFGSLTNSELPFDRLKAKDVLHLATSTKGKTNLGDYEIATGILKGYDANLSFATSLCKELQSDIGKQGKLRWMYTRGMHAISTKDEKSLKLALYQQLTN